MSAYRFYLLRPGGHVAAAENAECDDDSEAMEFAVALQDASSDVFVGCEVWRGTALVGAFRAGEGDGFERQNLEQILRKWACAHPIRQENLARLEHSLIEGFGAVQASKRLIEESRKLLDRCQISPQIGGRVCDRDIGVGSRQMTEMNAADREVRETSAAG